MTFAGILFLLLSALALLCLPRRWAPVPLLIASCYMTMGQGFSVGPFSFYVIRVLVGVGLLRILLRGERIEGKLNSIDWLMLLWGVWLLLSTVLHPGEDSALVFNLGQIYNILGIYFLIRHFCTSREDLTGLIKVTALLLGPIALEMMAEILTHKNFFSVFGAVNDDVMLRNDRFRAQGPFRHPILAGTVGSACFPLIVSLWHTHRKTALVGALSCVVMVVTSASSGPVLSFLLGCAALLFWRGRKYTRSLRWTALTAYIVLDLVMTRPAYFVMAYLDVAGGSTGWHRAQLIKSSLEHLPEWWLAGTNYTRDWMPTGVSWSGEHTDITSYYIIMGVWGGLLLVALFVAVILTAFRYVGKIASSEDQTPASRFIVWCIGSSLFVHAVTSVSVAYFDQSYIFVFLDLAVIASLGAAFQEAEEPASVPVLAPA